MNKSTYILIFLFSPVLYTLSLFVTVPHGDYSSYVNWYNDYALNDALLCGSASQFVCASFAIQNFLLIKNPYFLPIPLLLICTLLLASPFLLFLYIPLSYTLKQTLSIITFSFSIMLLYNNYAAKTYGKFLFISTLMITVSIHWASLFAYVCLLFAYNFPLFNLRKLFASTFKANNVTLLSLGISSRLFKIFLGTTFGISLSFFLYPIYYTDIFARITLYFDLVLNSTFTRTNNLFILIIYLIVLMFYIGCAPKKSRNIMFECMLLSLSLGIIAPEINRIYLYFYVPVIIQLSYYLLYKKLILPWEYFVSSFIILHFLLLSIRIWLI